MPVHPPRPSPAALRTIARVARLLEHAWPGATDVTLAQYRMLALIGGGSERASRIAEKLAVAKPTVSAMVDGLVERGLVARADVHDDRRAVRLTLTDRGRRALDDAERAMAARLEPAVARCADSGALDGALRDLSTALDAVHREREAARPAGDGAARVPGSAS